MNGSADDQRPRCDLQRIPVVLPDHRRQHRRAEPGRHLHRRLGKHDDLLPGWPKCPIRGAASTSICRPAKGPTRPSKGCRSCGTPLNSKKATANRTRWEQGGSTRGPRNRFVGQSLRGRGRRKRRPDRRPRRPEHGIRLHRQTRAPARGKATTPRKGPSSGRSTPTTSGPCHLQVRLGRRHLLPGRDRLRSSNSAPAPIRNIPRLPRTDRHSPDPAGTDGHEHARPRRPGRRASPSTPKTTSTGCAPPGLPGSRRSTSPAPSPRHSAPANSSDPGTSRSTRRPAPSTSPTAAEEPSTKDVHIFKAFTVPNSITEEFSGTTQTSGDLSGEVDLAEAGRRSHELRIRIHDAGALQRQRIRRSDQAPV